MKDRMRLAIAILFFFFALFLSVSIMVFMYGFDDFQEQKEQPSQSGKLIRYGSNPIKFTSLLVVTTESQDYALIVEGKSAEVIRINSETYKEIDCDYPMVCYEMKPQYKYEVHKYG